MKLFRLSFNSATTFDFAVHPHLCLATLSRRFNTFLDFSSSSPLPFAVKPTISNPMPMAAPQNQSINLINNFNNNYRNQTSGFPHCVAVYDFEAENAGELSFKVRYSFLKI